MIRDKIHRQIREYILRNFTVIAVCNTDILGLSCEDLLDLISDDMLNTKSEEPIWEFCLRWIEFDEKNRSQSIPLLLNGVRLGLLTQQVIIALASVG